MKTRKCFVSNSSTTSFVILGYNAYDDVFTDSVVSEIFQKDWVKYQRNIDSPIYIGSEIFSMKDDETKREFVERTKFALDSDLKNLGVDVSKLTFGWYSGGWYDG